MKGPVLATLFLATMAPAAAQAGSDGGDGLIVDRREIVVPARTAEVVRVDNLSGGSSFAGPRHLRADPHHRREARRQRRNARPAARPLHGVRERRDPDRTRVELGGRERSLPLAGSGIDLWLEVPPTWRSRPRPSAVTSRPRGCAPGPSWRRPAAESASPTCGAAWSPISCAAARRWRPSRGTSTSTAWRGTWTSRTSAAATSTRALVDGSIHAEDIRDDFVRLVTTTGQIVLIGVIRPARPLRPAQLRGRRPVAAAGEPSPFELRVRSATPLASAVPLHGSRREGEWLRAEYLGRRPLPHTRTALVELSSTLGGVVIESSPALPLSCSAGKVLRYASDSPDADRDFLGHTRQHRSAGGGSEGARCRGGRPAGLPGGHGGLRRQPERVLRPDPRKTAAHHPRQPRRRRRRADGLLVLLPRGPPRPRPARPAARPGEHGVAEGRSPTRSARATSTSATARPSTSRSSTTSSRAIRRRSAWRSGTTGAAHVHRSLAPLQVVRAVTRTASTRWSRTSSSCAPAGSTSSASARSASRATTIRAPATPSTTPTSARSSSSASSTT